MKSLPVFNIPSFTFIELLIVVGIIAVLTSLVLPSFGDFAQRRVLQNSSDKLLEDIKIVRNKALSGVRVVEDSVFWAFKADCGTNQYRLGSAVIQSDGTPAAPVYTHTFTLGEGVEFDDVTDTCNNDPVYFNRLSGDVYDISSTVEYRISYDSAFSGTQERLVYISPSGLIW